MTGSHTSCQVILLADNILVDGIDGLDICGVAKQGSHIRHTRIHITGPYGMAPSLCLVYDGFVALRVDILVLCLATIVEQELGLIEVFLLTGEYIQASQCHLRNLMTRHHTGLSRVGTYLLDDTVGIAFGNVEELCATCCLIVGTGGIHHVSEIVEFVAGVLLCCPAPVGSPPVGMLRVDGTGSIEIAVGLLGRCYYIEHGVNIGFEFCIGVGLQHIRSTFDSLVDIGIVKRKTHELRHIPFWCLQAWMSRVLKRIGRHLKILVAVLALTF